MYVLVYGLCREIAADLFLLKWVPTFGRRKKRRRSSRRWNASTLSCRIGWTR